MAKKQRTLRFEMPFQAAQLSLAKPELGIVSVRRRGPQHSFVRETTLLDTPDHRLLRAGITLAHRVVDGLGEWMLDAPGWGPWLPTRGSLQLGAAGDLPEEFADLVHPFRRRAALGPVAAIISERTEWQLLGPEREVLCTLRDERSAIRRGGVATARYRQASGRGTDELTDAQRRHVVELLTAAGGSRVDAFPTLAERIGPPATGLTDFRGPFERDEQASLEGFTSWLLARRLDGIMRADLELRSGRSDDMDQLREQLAELRREVRSLAFALEPAWREQLEAHVETVLGSLARLDVHRLGEEYFAVLDALVLAIRAPQLGDLSQQKAAEVLRQQTTAGATILLDRSRSLTLSSPEDRWRAALASARQMMAVAQTDRLLFGKAAKRMEQALTEAIELLVGCQMPVDAEAPAIDLTWDVVTAFQEGRHFERRRQECLNARRAFIAAWPELEQRIRSLKGRKP